MDDYEGLNELEVCELHGDYNAHVGDHEWYWRRDLMANGLPHYTENDCTY